MIDTESETVANNELKLFSLSFRHDKIFIFLDFLFRFGNIQMSSYSDSYGQRQAIAASAAIRKISMGCRSMPNSPRMMPKHAHAQPQFYRAPTSPAAAAVAASAATHSNGDILAAIKCNGHSKEHQKQQQQHFGSQNNSSWNFAALTDHLNVQQVNNYNQQSGFPEINWQERCLELQLELHRSKNQSERIRGMLRDKVRVK